MEAERRLMHPFNDCGSFLVHDSDITPGDYSLSVRDAKKVRHYRIQKLDDGGYIVVQQATFKTLLDLVAHNRQQLNGLCVILKNACFIAEKPQTTGISKEANEH